MHFRCNLWKNTLPNLCLTQWLSIPVREFRSVQTWRSSRNVINSRVWCVVCTLVWRFKRKCTLRSVQWRVTMTSYNDPRRPTWCHERKVRLPFKRKTSALTTPRPREFITLRDDRHVWTDRNSLTGINGHWVRHKFSKYFFINYT